MASAVPMQRRAVCFLSSLLAEQFHVAAASRAQTHRRLQRTCLGSGHHVNLDANAQALAQRHGLGDTAHGWVDTAGEIAQLMPHVKFVLPTASTRPITMNGGMPMPGWYDIESLARSRQHERCSGIEESCGVINRLIAKEMEAGIPASRIVLAGFSQGGAMSVYCGLNAPHTFAGLVIMSGYMPKPEGIKPCASSVLTPVRMFHGEADPLVLLDYAKDCLERLRGFGLKDSELKTYRGLPHSVSEPELRDVSAWLLKVLP